MFCPNCGKENQQRTRFCIYCGAALPEELPSETPAQRKVARPKSAFPIVGAVAIVLVILLAVGALVVLGRFVFFKGGDHVLLGATDREGGLSLYLVKLGQEVDKGVRLAQNVQQASGVSFGVYEDAHEYARWGAIGGFLPDSDRILYWYQDRSQTKIQELKIGSEEPSNVFETRASSLWGAAWAGSKGLFFAEYVDNGMRCYVARPGQPAERLGKGDSCGASMAGSMAFFRETDRDKTTLSVVGMDGKGETVLLEGVELAGDPRISHDGTRIAYIQQSRDGQEVYLVGQRGETPTQVGKAMYDVLDYGFSPTDSSVLYVIAENKGGAVELWLSTEETPIAEGAAIGASFSPDGRTLVYSTKDAYGDTAVQVRSTKGSDAHTVLFGDNLRFAMLAPWTRALALETVDDEVALHSIDLTSREAIELLREEDVYLQGIHYLPDKPVLYLYLTAYDGARSLYVTPVDRDDGYYLLEDWYAFTLLNRSHDGHRLVFQGQEDRQDAPILYVIDLEEGSYPVELDDDHDGFENAVFSPNDKSIIYTALSTGIRGKETEILKAPTDDVETPVVLYQDATLFAVRWGNLNPWRSTWWRPVHQSTSFCPGARSIVVGETLEGTIAAGGEVCYRLWAQEGDVFTLNVDTPQGRGHNLALALHNRQGNQLDYATSDYYRGLGPKLNVSVDRSEVYFVKLTELDGEEASFSLAAKKQFAVALLFPMTGPVPTYGQSSKEGAELAIRERNEAGGVLGMEVKPLLANTGCDGATATDAANKVIDQDGVSFIVGAVCSSASIPISEVANPKRVLQISPTSTNPAVTLGKPFVFRACFLDPFQGQALATFATEDLGARTAAVLYDRGNPYVLGLAEYFKQAFEARGGQVVVYESYTEADSLFSGVLAKIAHAQVDVLFLPDYYYKVNMIGRQAQSIDLDATLLGADGWDSRDLDTEVLEGAYYSNHFSLQDPRPIVQSFVDGYRAAYGTEPDALAVLAYDATAVLLKAIEAAGTIDPDQVRDVLAGIEFEGVTGRFVFNHEGDAIKSAAIIHIGNGAKEFVKFVSP